MPVRVVLARGSGCRWAASTRHAEEARCRGSTPSTSACARRSCDSGFLNAGTPLLTASTPDRATAPEEKARRSISSDSDSAPLASSAASALVVAGSIGPRSPTKMRIQADDDQQHQRDDVDVRRRGEQRAGLLEPAQVGDGHQQDADQADRHASTSCRSRNAERIASTPPATRHRDGEDVVDEQGRAGDERRDRAEVLLATRCSCRRRSGRRRSSGGSW